MVVKALCFLYLYRNPLQKGHIVKSYYSLLKAVSWKVTVGATAHCGRRCFSKMPVKHHSYL